VSNQRLTYAIVTPARNEADNLPRLAAALAAQQYAPRRWVIVDNGSTDETVALAQALAEENDWIELLVEEADEQLARGAPITRAFQRGLARLDPAPDVVVKLDADISVDPDYFDRLLAEFAADPSLGVSSGVCYEREDGKWRSRNMTGTSVWGAARSYRWDCLQDVLPLEERMGWDGIDEFKANARGWTTRLLPELAFRHHRREGQRDGRVTARVRQGRAARYMGYSPWYLTLRALHHARREPAAVAMIWGYTRATLAREPQCPDEDARAYLRRQQSLRRLSARIREASRSASTLEGKGVTS
jgi:biofilm PGA synthesis N-glycosyltransferase PgaC